MAAEFLLCRDEGDRVFQRSSSRLPLAPDYSLHFVYPANLERASWLTSSSSLPPFLELCRDFLSPANANLALDQTLAEIVKESQNATSVPLVRASSNRTCPDCDITFKSEYGLTRHLSTRSHSAKVASQKKVKEPTASPPMASPPKAIERTRKPRAKVAGGGIAPPMEPSSEVSSSLAIEGFLRSLINEPHEKSAPLPRLTQQAHAPVPPTTRLNGERKPKRRGLLKATELRPLYCSLCRIEASSEIDLRTHALGRLHQMKLGRATRFVCRFCAETLADEAAYASHINSEGHKAKLQTANLVLLVPSFRPPKDAPEPKPEIVKSKAERSEPTKSEAPLAALEGSLGYAFNDPQLLRHALISGHNDRMEFLGDSILYYLVAEKLFKEFPRYGAGNMTQLRQQLVRGSTLARVARDLKLADFGVENKDDVMDDTFEALVAAVYIDGGLEAASAMLTRTLWPYLGDGIVLRQDKVSPMSEVLMAAAGVLKTTPRFVIEQVGHAHTPRFRVRVLDGEQLLAEVEHPDMTAAQEAAAKAALNVIGALKVAKGTEGL